VDHEFISILNRYDFMALTETWTTVQSNKKVKTQLGHRSLHKIRQKRKIKGRPSGGILFFYKPEYSKYITEKQTMYEDTMVIKLDRHAGVLSNDLYFIITYIRPNLLKQHAESRFNALKDLVAEYSVLGETIILGDLYARTGCKPDYILLDSNKNSQLPVTYTPDQAMSRSNCDKFTNLYGNLLLELCKACEHRILNGRFMGDSMGYYTYFHEKGCSTIDYIATHHDLMDRVQSLTVRPELQLSDHAIIQLQLKTDGNTPQQPGNSNKLKPAYGKFIWDADSSHKFELSLLEDETAERMSKFLIADSNKEMSQKLIDAAVEEFSTILTDAGRKSLKFIPTRSKKPLNKSKKHKWYDSECRSLRSTVRQLITCKKTQLAPLRYSNQE
jgi:hypothetical protein